MVFTGGVPGGEQDKDDKKKSDEEHGDDGLCWRAVFSMRAVLCINECPRGWRTVSD
jgi:hypothetical protein